MKRRVRQFVKTRIKYLPVAVAFLSLLIAPVLTIVSNLGRETKASSESTWTVYPKDVVETATVENVQLNESGDKVQLEKYFNKNLVDKRLSNDRSTTRQENPAVTVDEDGNTYVAYNAVGSTAIYMQKISSAGEVLWEEDKSVFANACTNVTGTYTNQTDIALFGSGVVIVANCYNGSTNEIKAQYVNSSGVAQWGSDTRVNDDTTDDKIGPSVAVIGSEIFVVWQDERDGATNYDIYAQKLNSSGTRQIVSDQLISDQGATAVYGAYIGATSESKLIVSYAYSNTVYSAQYSTIFASEWGPTATGVGTIGSKYDFASTTFGTNSYHFYKKWSASPPSYQIYGQSMSNTGAKRWNSGSDLRVGRRIVPAIIQAWNDGTNPYFAAASFSGINYPCGKRVSSADGSVLWGGILDDEPSLTADSSASSTRFAVAYNSVSGTNQIFYYKINSPYQEDIFYNTIDTAGTVGGASDTVINKDYGSLNQQRVAIAKDSGGNIVAAWADSRSGVFASDVYVQKFNSSGTSQWSSDTKLNSATSNCSDIAITVNGTDIYVAWNSVSNVYLGKLNTSGATQWSDRKVNVGGTGATSEPSVAWDGSNAVVVWGDNRSGDGNTEVYFNSVNSSGTVQLGSDQRVNVTTTGKQEYPVIRSDTTNAYVVWEDARNGSNEDIFMQKVNGSGAPQYGSDVKIDDQSGVSVSSSNPDFILDSGNLYIVWEDDRESGDSYSDIYLAAFSGDTRLFSDVQVNDSSTGDKIRPKIGIASDELFIIWEDQRVSATYHDVYMAKFNTSGTKLYGTDSKVNDDTTTVINEYPAITPNDSYVAWDDDRKGASDKNIYLARGVDKNRTNGTMKGAGLIFDAETDQVRYNTIGFEATTPAGTEVKLRTRTAETQEELTSATWSSYYTAKNEGKSLFHKAYAESAIESDNLRFLELEISLASDDNDTTPLLDNVSLSYLTNQAPEFSTFSVASNSGGAVKLAYIVTDSDDTSEDISFKYYDGSWHTSPNTDGETTVTAGFGHILNWNAKADLGEVKKTVKVRLTADDGETFNNLGYYTSNEFEIDATQPVSAYEDIGLPFSIISTTTGDIIEQVTDKETGDRAEEAVKRELDKIAEIISSLRNSDILLIILLILSSFCLVLYGIKLLVATGFYYELVNHLERPLSLFAPAGKRVKRVGYAFDFTRKFALSGVRVEAKDVYNGRIVAFALTNNCGEFVLVLPSGRYRLFAKKEGYRESVDGPIISKFGGGGTDGYYGKIYFSGEEITLGEETEAEISIGLDPEAKGQIKKPGFSIYFDMIAKIFLVVGTALAIISYVLAYTKLEVIILAFSYFVLWSAIFLGLVLIKSRLGRIIDNSGNGVALALVRVFKTGENGRSLAGSGVSDRDGKFAMNISSGSHLITVRHPEYSDVERKMEVRSLSDIGELRIELVKRER
jgi:hypothetical protein